MEITKKILHTVHGLLNRLNTKLGAHLASGTDRTQDTIEGWDLPREQFIRIGGMFTGLIPSYDWEQLVRRAQQ